MAKYPKYRYWVEYRIVLLNGETVYYTVDYYADKNPLVEFLKTAKDNDVFSIESNILGCSVWFPKKSILYIKDYGVLHKEEIGQDDE